MNKKKMPWKCSVFGCDYGSEGMKATRVTDSIAVLRWTCKRCGKEYEHMFMCLSDAAMKKYREQKDGSTVVDRNDEG